MSLIKRFVSILRGRKLDRELDDELRSHLEMRVQDNIDAGMTEKDAQLDAMRRFGNLGMIKENTRSFHIVPSLETVLQDLRFGWRTLRRSPGFTTVALLTIAFSIGATTAVVTMVDSVLLRPLPYREPDRVISGAIYIPVGGFNAVPGADLVAWQEQARSFDAIAGFAGASFTLTETGDPVRVMAARVTSNFLPLLGAAPQIGRVFSVEEDRPHGELVALMSHGLWQERFGADPQVVGKRISLDGARYTVIGVLSAGFRFPSTQLEPEILVPLQLPRFASGQVFESQSKPKDDNFVLLEGSVARLKSSVSLETAAAELDSISSLLYDQYPLGYRNFLKGRRVEVASLRDSLVGKVRRPLLIMLAAVGLVLLIGCLNIASLQLARGVERGGELSVRAALGARQGRLLRQLVTENILLSCVGSVLGVALAVWAVSIFRAAAASALPSVATVRVDLWVLGFAALTTLACGTFFGLVPALGTNRKLVSPEAFKTRHTTAGRTQRRFTNILVTGELALSLVLLAGAGLLVRSYYRLTSEDLGINFHDVLTARLELSKRYSTTESQQAFVRQLLAEVEASPGVESAAICNSLPLAPWLFTATIQPEGRVEPGGAAAPTALVQGVSAGYFRAFQIPLIQGRSFMESDKWDSPRVAMVNQAFARSIFPGQEVIGKRVHVAPKMDTWVSIVGLVGDDRHGGLAEAVRPELFTPYEQPVLSNMSTAIAVRSRNDPGELTASLRHSVSRLDSNQAIFDVATMEERLTATLSDRKLQMWVLLCFAGMALVLGIVGIYGVMSYSVAQRSHEIGVRIALGSDQARVLRLVLTEALMLSLAGVAIGVAGALGVTRFMSSLLYGVTASDPFNLISVSLLLIAAGALAGYLPARQASQVDPMIVLRRE